MILHFLFSKDCNVIVVILLSIQVLFFPFVTLFFVGVSVIALESACVSGDGLSCVDINWVS